MHFADNTARLKYMKRSQVGKSGSWPVEGILHYEEIYGLDLQEREGCLVAEDESPCNKWSFLIGSDDEDDGGNSTVQMEEARIMILEIDHSAFDWGVDDDDSDNDDESNINMIQV